MTSLFLLSVIPIPAVANEVAIDNVFRLRHHLPSSSPHNRVPVLSCHRLLSILLRTYSKIALTYGDSFSINGLFPETS